MWIALNSAKIYLVEKKLNLLIKADNDHLLNELKESFSEKNTKIFSATSIDESISVLYENNIDEVILEIMSLNEVNLLDHINRYYKNTKIHLITSKKLETFFKTIRNSNFSILKNPLNFSNLNNAIKKNNNTL